MSLGGWVLIVYMIRGPMSAQFETREACEAAKAWVLKQDRVAAQCFSTR